MAEQTNLIRKHNKMRKKQILYAIITGLLFCSPVFANSEQEKLNNIAIGVLANIGIDVGNIVVLDTKPLKENNTILQIAYKDLIDNQIKMVYAINDKAVIANGILILDGKVNNEFIDKLERVTPIKGEILQELSTKAIKITDKRDEKKEELFIALSPLSVEFDFLFNSNHYMEILEKYNLSIIFVNIDDTSLLKTANFLDNNTLDIKTIKQKIKDTNGTQKIDDTKIDYLNSIKKLLKIEKKLNEEEKNGLSPIYFINNQRINPNRLINSLNVQKVE